MAEITAATIKTLRDRTSAGIMDCKRALNACDGDMEASIDWLRKKGHARLAKKSSREAREGVIALATDENRGVLVELSSETDFVARNDIFRKAASDIADLMLLHCGEGDESRRQDIDNKARECARDAAVQLGENIAIKRSKALEAPQGGKIASYLHNNRIGVLAAFSGGTEDMAHKIAMHISAAQPAAITREDIDPALIKRERDVLLEQAQQAGKPEKIIEKMVEGRLKNFYQQMALVEQEFVLDEDFTAGQILKEADMRLHGFICFVLGED